MIRCASAEQVNEYATKWFVLDIRLLGKSGRRKQRFLAESRRVPDIRSHPLIGLFANLYSEENYIRRIVGGVRKCAERLLDDGTEIDQFQYHCLSSDSAGSRTRLWLYTTEVHQVPEATALPRAADLSAPKVGDRDQAEACSNFIEFCGAGHGCSRSAPHQQARLSTNSLIAPS